MGSIGETVKAWNHNDGVENQWMWNAKVPTCAESTVHELIAQRVQDQPNAAAVCAWDGSLTYQELDRLSRRLACHLVQKLGIGEGSIIPLCFEKSMWTPVAMLAVMKTGAASVALDVTLPKPRLQSITQQIQPNVILSSKAQCSLAGNLAASPVLTVDCPALDAMDTAGVCLPNVDPSSTLYVVFTSGSTGTPKGVMISHRNICSGLRHQRALGYANARRVFDFASYAFDAAWLNFLHATVSGACLCIPSETDRRENITKCMQDMRVDFALLTPSIARVINPAAVPALRTLVLGGEAMAEVDIMTWASQVDLRNAYGPAECTIVATAARIGDSTGQSGNIGYGLGLNTWVVSLQGDCLASIGSVGELWLEGPLVGKGYLNDPGRTDASFVHNPPWLTQGCGLVTGRRGRLYRTGDLVRYEKDGSLVFVGRKDSQVKIRGQRVELGDIEYHVQSGLSQQLQGPAVAILATPCGSDKTFLVVFLSVSRAFMESYHERRRMVQDLTSALHDKLVEDLPMYMVPSAYVPVAEMPMTATGKTDRRQLREMANAMKVEELVQLHPKWEGKRAPVTEMEKRLQELWAQVLNINSSSIGLDDTFFSHGGDSISAIQLSAKCRAAGFSITIPQIFRHKSLQDLATAASPLPSLVTKPIVETNNARFALSPAQQYFFEHHPDGNNHFNQSFFLRVTQTIDPARLGKSLQQLVSWHPILRARFNRAGDGSWMQSIQTEAAQCYHYHVTRIEEPNQVKDVLNSAQKRLDIEKGPLISFDLIQTVDSQFLFLVAHHLVVDLVSWRILIEELEELLTTENTTREHSSLSFQAWCKMQETYSMQHLLPEKSLPFPVTIPSYDWWGLERKENTHAHAVRKSFLTCKSVTHLLLGEANHAFQTRPVEILHAVLLHSFAMTFRDRPPPTVFSEGHGREAFDDTIDLSRTVGWFTTIWPAHVEWNNRHSITEVVRRTKDARRRVPMNGWAYFASRYLNESGKDMFRGHGLPEILFNFEGLYQQLERPNSLFRNTDKPHDTISDFSGTTHMSAIVDVTALVVDGCLTFQFLYNGNMKQRDGVERWIAQCKESLELAGHELVRLKPSYTMCDFPLLSLTDETLKKLNEDVLPELGISYGEVEDIYPCSPVQQGILLSQAKNSGWYNTQVVWRIRSSSPISVTRLQLAWKEVVKRHPILRTVFTDGMSPESYRDQIVLRKLEPEVNCDCQENGTHIAASKTPQPNWKVRPLHSLSLVSRSSGDVTAELNINHAIIDAASMEILRRDLCLTYSGLSLPTNDVSYRGYIEVVQGFPVDPARAFWKKYLEGVKPSIFPSLRSDTPTDRTHVELPVTRVAQELQANIHTFCERHGVTPSNIFQLAWALVLRYYLNDEAVCFGYIVSGRDAPIAHVEDIVGPFINMLVSRFDLNDSVTVLEILKDTQDNYLEGLDHQHYPLASVLNSLGMTGKQLFNTVLQVQRNVTSNEIEGSAISVDIIEYDDPMEFDISITVTENTRDMAISLQYDPAIMTETQAISLIGSFQKFVEEIIQLPKSKPDNLIAIGNQDLSRVWGWNKEILSPNSICVHDLFSECVRQQPDAPAVCAWDGNLTYSQLDELSTSLAYRLLAHGIGPGSIVPLCFEKSLWTPVAVLGVMKTGAASVMLDVTLPRQRLLSVINQLEKGRVGASVILSSTSQYKVASDLVAGLTICVDALDQINQPPGPKLPNVDPSNTLYVVFTSGSTGTPKGAMISHTNFSSGIWYQLQVLGLSSTSRVFDFASYAFDVCWSSILHTLVAGGCICTPSTAQTRNDIHGALAMMRANWALLTPTVARLLDPATVGHGFVLVLIGEKMTDEDVTKWQPHVDLVNAYGPAECTVINTVNRVNDIPQGSGNIGRCFGCHTWVVSPSNHHHLLPVGCTGELLIEGPLVGQGYLNDPAKTVSHFVEAPSWLKQGSRTVPGRKGLLYRTGDLVQYQEDGSLKFMGRRDDQVKIHGQRVELGDVEHHVRQILHDQFQEPDGVVAEILQTGIGDAPVLVVFLTAGKEDGVSGHGTYPALHRHSGVLREGLLTQLPLHMVPASFIVVEAIPTTATGKTDRRKLRELGGLLTREELAWAVPTHTEGVDTEGNPTLNSMELQLRELWAQVLRISPSRINGQDSFLQIGGDSVGAMRLVAAARNQGLSLNVEKVFQSPRLCEMALATGISHETRQPIPCFSLLSSDVHVSKLCEDVAQRCNVPVDKIQDVFPCTPLQEGLLALSAKQPGNYVNQVTMKLSQGTNLAQLIGAWNKVIQETPILRTRIVDTPGLGLVQAIISEEVTWRTAYDLSVYLKQDTQTHIGLGTPLVRFAVVKDEQGGEGSIVWTIHHALYDGWSMQLILDQVHKVYHTKDTLPIGQFQRFLQYTLQTEDSQDEFWQRYLSGADIASFPSLPSPSYRPQANAIVSHNLTNIKWPESDNITSATVIRAAWAILQSQYTNTCGVCFGAIVSGRQAPVVDIEWIAGPTIATVPIHVNIDRMKDIRGLLLQIQADAAAMIPFEQTGLLKIRRTKSDVAKVSEFQTLLVIQPVARDEQPPHVDDLWSIEKSAHDTSAPGLNAFNNYSILVDCELKSNGAELTVSFDTHVIDECFVQRMVTQLEHIIESICNHPLDSTLVKDMTTISTTDLDDIRRWNRTAPEPHTVCVHDWIIDQARKHPAKMAVLSWDGSLTYEELDKLSTSLAQSIIPMINPGSIIPLCFEKSMWTPVAMLAVMKAGAASVALDTTLPKQRLQAIADQVKPRLILSSKASATLALTLLGDVKGSQVITVDYDGIKTLEVKSPKLDLPIVDPSSTLYLVFTSGSTGSPKGAMVSHANFSSGLFHQLSALQYNTDTRAFDFASYAFDVSRTVCLRTLAAGGCLCVPHETDRRNNTAQSMCQLGVNHAHLTPTMARLLLPSEVPALRTLVLGGEPIGKDDVDKWYGHVSLINTYGPAEATSTNTIQRINNTEAPCIGRGIGCTTWIADPLNPNHLLPIGCAGELLIEGPLVGQGYLGDGESTMTNYIENPPWLLKMGRRGILYRTGDLVRYNSDGSLMFIGRKDAQVKIRGQRVELGDIEHHVRSILVASDFQGSIAAGVTKPQGNSAAFVVAFLTGDKTHSEPNTYIQSLTNRLNDGLANELPSYMIPRVYIPLNAMPLTATGKIDRRRIQEMSERLTLDDIRKFQPQHQDRHAPTTDMELRLAQLWGRVLNISTREIASEDSFLQVGGDSVGAMRLVGAARDQSLSLTVEQVFKSPRLRDMALLVKAVESSEKPLAPFSLLHLGVPEEGCPNIDTWRARAALLCNVKPSQVEDVFPCTPLQQGILALSQKRPGHYINHAILQIDRTKVSLDRLKQAWQQTIQMTPILRTRIIDVEGHDILQVVISEENALKSLVGCTLESYIENDRRNTMTFGTPLARVAFIEESNQSGDNAIENKSTRTVYIVWTMHHAVYDGWTMELILNQVHNIYREKDDRPCLEPFQKFLQYSIKRNDAEERFWNNYLSKSDMFSFPALPSTSYEPQANTSLQHEINDLTWRRKDDITASTMMRTAWGILLSCYTTTPDVLFGATVTGRQAPVAGIENVAGPTIATVPVTIGVDPHITVHELLHQVQRQALDMIPFEQTGLQRIRRISANTNRGCQFQTLIVVQPPSSNQRVREESIWQVVGREDKEISSFNSYAVLVECQMKSEGVHIEVSFDSQVIDTNTMSRMLKQLHHILRLLCADQSNELQVSALEITGPEDLHSIWSWNSLQPAAYEAPVHEMIVARARRSPDALAICAWDGELTFKELDDLSTCLADYLLAHHSCVGSIIPLCFEKSMWTPVAMLAVMKAGAGAVALDVDLPKQRLQSIVSQVNPVVILSSVASYELANGFNGGAVIVVDHQSIYSMKCSLNSNMHKLTSSSTNPSLPPVDPSSILYIVFTSGSTGTPKGVMVSHGNFSTALRYQQDVLGYASATRVLDSSSYAFDAAWLNFIHSTVAGACLCIPAEHERKTNVGACIDRMRVDFALLTPSVARLIDPESVPTLRTLVLGGEAHNPTDVARWKSDRVDLRNAYGPAECTVVATVTQLANGTTKPGNIGRGWGLNTWVIDVSGNNRLAPIGAVGELWLEGPLVAQGYLGDSKKTLESFVKTPPWLARGIPTVFPGRQGRLYRTGDLVRYNHDGSLTFVGRKDSQVKIRGQRVELDDIEYHVRQSLPKQFRGAVIADVFAPRESDHAILAVFLSLAEDVTLSNLLEGLGEKIMDLLPEYMIPTAYIPVHEIPMTATGKTDRLKLREIGSSLTVAELAGLRPSQNSEPPVSEREWQLHAMWAEVLNVEPSLIGRNDSFFGFGGDSITAMQLCAKCRMAGISMTVPQVFHYRTIARLASVVTTDVAVQHHNEVPETDFSLSPIQLRFFEYEPNGHDHFNQSMLLQLTRQVSSLDVAQALESLLVHHSMLRAQFSKGPQGAWTQRINATAGGSGYRYRSHQMLTMKDSIHAINESQKSLNIREGPLMAADLFTTEEDGQYLFVVVHHLAIDLVSWRVLLEDLEEHLTTGGISSVTPLPFQVWCEGQVRYARKHLSSHILPPLDISSHAHDYWGVDMTNNIYGTVLEESFTISPDITQVLLGPANTTYQTQPVEIFHAALVYSFAQVFQDRQPPPIFTEGHGREPWNLALDPSRTVGWFTTLWSVLVTPNIADGFEDTIRRVKDSRRRVPMNGWASFTAMYLSSEDNRRRYDVPEIMFNYLGLYQQLERPKGLFRLADAPAGALSNIADNVHRFSLIDVSALVMQGDLHFKFSYNRFIRNQEAIADWIIACKSVLEEAASTLVRSTQARTLSDFPLLPLSSYDELNTLINHTLPSHGIMLDQVEDIYPCSPIQQGILLSQAKNESRYWTRKRWQVHSSSPICLQRFKDAWNKLVDRHPILRTVFIESALPDAYLDQVVLKSVTPEIHIVTLADVDLESSLMKHKRLRKPQDRLPYVLVLYATPSGRVICELLINHAITDGMSMRLIQDELQLAYDDALPLCSAPPYSDYIAHLRSLAPDTSRTHWQQYLVGVSPCMLPHMNVNHQESDSVKRLPAMHLGNELNSCLRDLCKRHVLTASNIFQVAWAVVLHFYTGHETPCFGYLTSGRDAPIDNVAAIAGPFINMLISRICLSHDRSILSIMQETQADYLRNLEHQHLPLAEILHSLPASTSPLFNTAISVQTSRSGPADSVTSTIRLQDTATEDPSEYDIAINLFVDDGDVQVNFSYSTIAFSDEQVSTIRGVFMQAVREIVLSPLQEIGQLNIMNWSSMVE
ncbi:NRPS [Aspergillus flavus]|nr:NRPS [Aspergillus flavus]